MAKDRIEPCVSYTHEGMCKQGRIAEHNKYCQKCKLYEPRVRRKHPNMKKQKLEKIKKNEKY